MEKTEVLYFLTTPDGKQVLTNLDTGKHQAYANAESAEIDRVLHYPDLVVTAREVVDE